jgi:DHA2 family multidrug resistance protein
MAHCDLCDDRNLHGSDGYQHCQCCGSLYRWQHRIHHNEAEWVLTVYLVANAVFLPASTWFSERFGRKRFLMTSIVVFTAASLGCGIAPNLPFILFARAVQGAGGGALQPLAQSILIESFPPAKRG